MLVSGLCLDLCFGVFFWSVLLLLDFVRTYLLTRITVGALLQRVDLMVGSGFLVMVVNAFLGFCLGLLCLLFVCWLFVCWCWLPPSSELRYTTAFEGSSIFSISMPVRLAFCMSVGWDIACA